VTLALHWSEHDTLPEEQTRVIDEGIGEYNDAAAPLHEVQPLAVFVRGDDGAVVGGESGVGSGIGGENVRGPVIGGAIGRTWGVTCELRLLWVHAQWRGQGLGMQLMQRFEQRAASRGVRHVYLETWTFQAPDFYERLGYRKTHTNANFPHGLAKFVMERWLDGRAG
jgi:GNAT superfamily N-acetyltransferase